MSEVRSLDRINQCLERLRHLNQVSLHAGWHSCADDWPIEQAVQPETWQTWPLATPNDKQHLPWPQGRQVRWLGQTIVVPTQLQGYPLAGMELRLSLLWWAEAAQIYVNGQLVQEGDLFDAAVRVRLSRSVIPGQAFVVALRLVSPGHDAGALMRSLCLYEATESTIPEPSFIADEWAVLSSYLQQFDPNRLPELAAMVETLDWSLVADRPRFNQALMALRDRLRPWAAPLKQRQIHLVGHAHLDLAWLWPVTETWAAAERTFRSVLHLQAAFPNLTFCHSTPALYAWMEQQRPELFAQIQSQVQAGRWEVVGGLWLEPELNLISGESIARHLLYGQRYSQEKFGQSNQVAWLPDTFGFGWQLPQLLRQGGIEYFVTQKLRWNDTTPFPHDLFWWQAPDGSRILSLMSAPIGEAIAPLKMADFAWNWQTKTGLTQSLWLPGVGDHGGGPTRDMLEVGERWAASPFFPELNFTTAIAYLNQVAETADALPIWESELYLEFHRGCYTTHADQKRWNRRSEELLFEAELFAALATIATGIPYPQAELATAWKQTLFNQFHDILPGTAIPDVFTEANQAWEAVQHVGQQLRQQALQSLAMAISLPSPPHPQARAIVVFNSLNWERSQSCRLSLAEVGDWASQGVRIVDLQGQPVPCQLEPQPRPSETWHLLFWAEAIPAMGYRCFWLCPDPQGIDPLFDHQVTETPVLENEFLRVQVDPHTGDLCSVYDKRQQWEVLSGAGNQLQAFADRGQYWDAWNIDPDYASHPLPAAQLRHMSHAIHRTLETVIRVERQIGQSVFQQEYVLAKGSPYLEIRTQVDWQERHVLLKVAFPLTIAASEVTYEIPCGAIARPTCPQNDRERAMWEVPALRWADLSQTDQHLGVSLLNDSKYGYDSQPSQLRLTLLRGAEWPDPEADRGLHSFTYALYPHAGSWQAAQTVQQGYNLNQPLHGVLCPHQANPVAATLSPVGSLLNLGADNLVVMAFKPLEDNQQQWLIRCYESQGQTAVLHLISELGLQCQTRLNLLEHPLCDQTSALTVNPWQIATVQVQR